ncbi:MAG: hypothetical protein J6Y48_16800, partial [Clostridia bacterium]|nr:hypothetical protein [Clostridia bacterium]
MNNPNENPNIGGKGTPETGEGTKKKMTLMAKAMKARDKVMASRTGRSIVRTLKVISYGSIGFLGYKAGVRSGKPTTI